MTRPTGPVELPLASEVEDPVRRTIRRRLHRHSSTTVEIGCDLPLGMWDLMEFVLRAHLPSNQAQEQSDCRSFVSFHSSRISGEIEKSNDVNINVTEASA